MPVAPLVKHAIACIQIALRNHFHSDGELIEVTYSQQIPNMHTRDPNAILNDFPMKSQ